MRPSWLVTALLIAPIVQGCLGLGGSDGAEGDEALVKNRADVSDSTGGIEGIVTDNTVAPVAGADIGIVELQLNATTASDGSYAFSNVRPGSYTVVTNAAGFVPGTQTIDVRSGSVATADFVLVHLQSDVPYQTTMELAGFMECTVAAGYNISALPVPPEVSFLTGSFFVCNWPNLVAPHTTNDVRFHEAPLDANVHTAVVESTWEAGGNPLQKSMWLRFELAPFADVFAGPWTAIEAVGITSPYRGEVNRTWFEDASEWLAEQCDGGDDRGCISPFDSGWPMRTSLTASYDCLAKEVSVCAPTQVSFTNYVTAFYNAPGPAGFSALSTTTG